MGQYNRWRAKRRAFRVESLALALRPMGRIDEFSLSDVIERTGDSMGSGRASHFYPGVTDTLCMWVPWVLWASLFW